MEKSYSDADGIEYLLEQNESEYDGSESLDAALSDPDGSFVLPREFGVVDQGKCFHIQIKFVNISLAFHFREP